MFKAMLLTFYGLLYGMVTFYLEQASQAFDGFLHMIFWYTAYRIMQGGWGIISNSPHILLGVCPNLPTALHYMISGYQNIICRKAALVEFGMRSGFVDWWDGMTDCKLIITPWHENPLRWTGPSWGKKSPVSGDFSSWRASNSELWWCLCR